MRTVGVRVTAAEAAEIEARAAAARLSPAAYMRRRSLGRPPVRVTAVHRLGAAERVELQRIGSNLNQIARALNAGGGVPAGLGAELARVGDLLVDLLTGEGWEP